MPAHHQRHTPAQPMCAANQGSSMPMLTSAQTYCSTSTAADLSQGVIQTATGMVHPTVTPTTNTATEGSHAFWGAHAPQSIEQGRQNMPNAIAAAPAAVSWAAMDVSATGAKVAPALSARSPSAVVAAKAVPTKTATKTVASRVVAAAATGTSPVAHLPAGAMVSAPREVPSKVRTATVVASSVVSSSKSARAGTASPITGSPLPQRPMVLPLPVSSPHMPSSQLANDTIAFAQVGGGTATLSWLQQQQQQQQQQQPSPAAMPPQQPSPATTITTIIGAPVPPSE